MRPVGGGQRVEGQHPEAGRAVEHDDVVVAPRGLEDLTQHELPGGPAEQDRLGARQVDGARQEVDAVLAGHDDLAQLGLTQQDVVDRALDGVGVDAEAVGQAGLRVEVDEEDALAELGEGGAQRGHRGGLCDAALLVRDGDDLRPALAGGCHDRGLPSMSRCAAILAAADGGDVTRRTGAAQGGRRPPHTAAGTPSAQVDGPRLGLLERRPPGLLRPHGLALRAVRAEVAPRADRSDPGREEGRVGAGRAVVLRQPGGPQRPPSAPGRPCGPATPAYGRVSRPPRSGRGAARRAGTGDGTSSTRPRHTAPVAGRCGRRRRSPAADRSCSRRRRAHRRGRRAGRRAARRRARRS